MLATHTQDLFITPVLHYPTTPGKKKAPQMRGFLNKIRRRPTLPRSPPRSTIGAEELNFRVRNGNGCDLFAIATENFSNPNTGESIKGP